MKRIHPSAIHAACIAVLAPCILAGCRSQSGSMANPFLAPDRVPPPATRVLAPGQAQPYYPGDPLPVMQSNAASQLESNGLAWMGTENSAPLPSQRAATETPVREASVAIPNDNESLRFALAENSEPETMVPAAEPPQQFAQQPPPPPPVQQASYTEPVVEPLQPAPSGPWRSPHIAPPALPAPPPATNAHVAVAPGSPPLVAIPQTMDVRLRAVPSPPPIDSSAPRIRLPGQPLVQSASTDGFRPRGSMR